MDRERLLKLLQSVVVGVVAIAAIFIASSGLLQAGLEPVVAVAAGIVTVLGPIRSGIKKVIWNRTADDAPAGQPDPKSRYLTAVPRHEGVESIEEFADRLRNDPKYKPGGKRHFPGKSAKGARGLKRVARALSISERTRGWVYRSLAILVVLAGLWLVMLGLRALDATGMYTFSETTLEIIYAVRPPTFDPLTDYFLYLVFPLGILLTASWMKVVHADSTCPECGESFALESEGCYYTLDGKTSQSETVDGEVTSWHEYDGWLLLQCTECDKPQVVSTGWNDR